MAALARTATAVPEFRDDERVLTVDVDVTDRSAVFAAVDRVVDHFGRLDVVVNNAGTMWTGFVEEFTEEQARAQMETNFFGALWVTQAVLPALRRRRGRLLQISSIAGIAAFPTTGLYSASKFALEGLSEAVAAEAAHFGVAVTIVEPGGYWTDLYKDMPATAPLDDYAALRAETAATSAAGGVDSEPALAAAAVRAAVDSDVPPRRLILGSVVYDAAVGLAQDRIRDWAAWEKVSRAAEHAVPAPPGYTT
ncbi:short chain dehydrogenase [Rhodococcus ruber BKS 20-38]|uniref:Short chain dehydrogenase n=1 Tax=Rhodococcus ruber BKS 20-38 TaxID=1278076 RepID=M2Z5L5_9NOCA|nr:short chain dehydrogenase [Rhodococcus ruber BKS 20-38]